MSSTQDIEEIITKKTGTQTPVKKQKKFSVFEYVQFSVLGLVVVSNTYFGYMLTTNRASAATVSTVSSATTATDVTSQLEPASVPKMVGGC